MRVGIVKEWWIFAWSINLPNGFRMNDLDEDGKLTGGRGELFARLRNIRYTVDKFALDKLIPQKIPSFLLPLTLKLHSGTV
jgi:hypothetical protein